MTVLILEIWFSRRLISIYAKASQASFNTAPCSKINLEFEQDNKKVNLKFEQDDGWSWTRVIVQFFSVSVIGYV